MNIMLRAHAPNHLCVDDAIAMLYAPPPMRDIAVELELRERDNGGDYSELGRPSRSRLNTAIDRTAWTAEVVAHLEDRLPREKDLQHNEWKLGVRGLIPEANEHSQQCTVFVQPQPWWVEREFNRSLLRATTDSDLRRLGTDLATDLLSETDAGMSSIKFPCSLYVEVAITCADDTLLVLRKNAERGSNEAAAGRPWTCSVEEGAKLSDASDARLDLARVAQRGLREELEITDLRSLNFYAIAMQVRHLNCSILGVANVGERGSDLAARARKAQRDFDDAQACPLSDAIRLLKDPPTEMSSERWHATARLRLLLALAERGIAPWPRRRPIDH